MIMLAIYFHDVDRQTIHALYFVYSNSSSLFFLLYIFLYYIVYMHAYMFITFIITHAYYYY